MNTNAFALVGGPYSVPQVSVGDAMFCVRRKRIVRVHGLAGILRWPASHDRPTESHHQGGSKYLIVTDELLRAVAAEKPKVFSQWFGCSVSFWRQMCVHYGFPTSRISKVPGDPDVARPLFGGPYQNPGLNVGNYADCKDRGRVIVQRLSGPIGWPRVSPALGNPLNRQGRPTLLVTDELIRALSVESNTSFAYWFGVEFKTCSRLRRKFGIAPITDGTSFLHSEHAARNSQGRRIAWTKEMIDVLGTAPDTQVSWTLDLCMSVIRKKRKELGIPAFISPHSPRALRGAEDKSNRPPDYSTRSVKWNDFRKEFIVGKTCAACDGSRALDVHHILPVHIRPDLEFDESNLIVLCDDAWKNCHHRIGHGFHWKSYNPNVIDDAAASLRSIQSRVAFA